MERGQLAPRRLSTSIARKTPAPQPHHATRRHRVRHTLPGGGGAPLAFHHSGSRISPPRHFKISSNDTGENPAAPTKVWPRHSLDARTLIENARGAGVARPAPVRRTVPPPHGAHSHGFDAPPRYEYSFSFTQPSRSSRTRWREAQPRAQRERGARFSPALALRFSIAHRLHRSRVPSFELRCRATTVDFPLRFAGIFGFLLQIYV